MNTSGSRPTHNNEAYTVQIIETYHGEEISAEIFESRPREDLSERGIFIAKPERPFGVRVFDADVGETVPFGVTRFEMLDAARDAFAELVATAKRFDCTD